MEETDGQKEVQKAIVEYLQNPKPLDVKVLADERQS